MAEFARSLPDEPPTPTPDKLQTLLRQHAQVDFVYYSHPDAERALLTHQLSWNERSWQLMEEEPIRSPYLIGDEWFLDPTVVGLPAYTPDELAPVLPVLPPEMALKPRRQVQKAVWGWIGALSHRGEVALASHKLTA